MFNGLLFKSAFYVVVFVIIALRKQSAAPMILIGWQARGGVWGLVLPFKCWPCPSVRVCERAISGSIAT